MSTNLTVLQRFFNIVQKVLRKKEYEKFLNSKKFISTKSLVLNFTL